MPSSGQQCRVFRLNRNWCRFFQLICPLLAVLAVIVPVVLWRQEPDTPTTHLVILIACAGSLAALCVYTFAATFRERIELHEDRIRRVGVFTKRELLYDEIQGFYVLPAQYLRTVVFKPVRRRGKKLYINLVLDNQAEFVDWLTHSFTLLDRSKARKAAGKILQRGKPLLAGRTCRRSRRQARRVMKLFNGASWLLAFWLFACPCPYPWCIGVGILAPVLALTLFGMYRGVMELDPFAKETNETTLTAFTVVSLCLLIRALRDFQMLSWDSFWLPFVCAFLGMFALVLFFGESVRHVMAKMAVMGVLSVAYAYGAVICANGAFDTSVPQTYRAEVIGKRIEGDRCRIHNLKLTPWGPVPDNNDVHVSKDVYDHCEIGESVSVRVKAGALGIPWYFVP